MFYRYHDSSNTLLIRYLIPLLAVLLLVSACTTSDSTDDSSSVGSDSDRAHLSDESSEDPIDFHPDVPHPDAGISEMSQLSDIVVTGVVVDQTENVELVEQPLMPPGYTVYFVRVDEVLAGASNADESSVAIEEVQVAIMTHLGDREIAAFEGRQPLNLVSGDRGVWFLLEIDPQFDLDGYVVLNGSGLVIERPDGSVESMGWHMPFGEEVQRLGSFEAVAHEARESE